MPQLQLFLFHLTLKLLRFSCFTAFLSSLLNVLLFQTAFTIFIHIYIILTPYRCFHLCLVISTYFSFILKYFQPTIMHFHLLFIFSLMHYFSGATRLHNPYYLSHFASHPSINISSTSHNLYSHLNYLPLCALLRPRSTSLLSPPNPLSLFHLSTVLLASDVHLNPGSNLLSNLLLCILNTRSMLTPLYITALNDLTDNVKPDVLAITETWIRTTTTTADLIDSTPPGYSLFSAPRTSASHPFKTTSGGGTTFHVKEPATILNSTAHSYSSFEYSSITLKITKILLTIFNIYRVPPPSPHSQHFPTFHNQFSSFLSSPATTPMTS